MEKFDDLLLKAVWLGDPRVVALLLQCGANPNAQDLFDNALQSAMGGRAKDAELEEICDQLISYGADPFFENHAGVTAAETALQLGLLSLYLKWLYRKGNVA